MKLVDYLALTLYTSYIGVRRQQLKQVLRLHVVGRPTFDRYLGQDSQAGMSNLKSQSTRASHAFTYKPSDWHSQF